MPATSPPGSHRLSQIQGWDTEHLQTAAAHWTATATTWETVFTAVNTSSTAPGGTVWEGEGAERAFQRTYSDRLQVVGVVDQFHAAAMIANAGHAELSSAKQRVLSVVQSAHQAGFAVDDDLSVRDTRLTTSAAARSLRQHQAATFAGEIRTRTTELISADQRIATQLNSIGAGFREFNFPLAPPFPLDVPKPPPVHMWEYIPRTWGACAVSGADPYKEVIRFYRAPATDTYASMPSGDSVLYCGSARDDWGLLHISSDHGRDWSGYNGFFGGNWRYLADYSITQTLAYPERTIYRPDNDTFAYYRQIRQVTSDGMIVNQFWCRVVVSASDGHIITAFPQVGAPQ